MIASHDDVREVALRFPGAFVALDAVDVQEARELVTESWRLRAPRSLVKEWHRTAEGP